MIIAAAVIVSVFIIMVHRYENTTSTNNRHDD